MKALKVAIISILLAIVGYFDYQWYSSLYHFLGVCLLVSYNLGAINSHSELSKLHLTFKKWLGL
jgi:hypothetical protein